MDFPDKWAAFEWMYRKQLGRRNITDEQRTYMIGKMYEARKKSVGGNYGNQYTKVAIDQNDPKPNKPLSTAQTIAQETGVTEPTVKRAAKFSKGIDAIREQSPEAAEKVLSGETKISKQAVRNIPKMETEKKREIIKAINEGKPLPCSTKQEKRQSQKKEQEQEQQQSKQHKQSENNEQLVQPIITYTAPKADYRGGSSAEHRQELKEVAKIIADMHDPSSVPEYTVQDLVDEIIWNGNEYIGIVRRCLVDRSTVLTDENRPVVVNAMNEIIENFKKVRDLVAVS